MYLYVSICIYMYLDVSVCLYRQSYLYMGVVGKKTCFTQDQSDRGRRLVSQGAAQEVRPFGDMGQWNCFQVSWISD